ncbi:MAG: hypothetical protein V7675_15390 [Hyphomonas sp.]
MTFIPENHGLKHATHTGVGEKVVDPIIAANPKAVNDILKAKLGL